VVKFSQDDQFMAVGGEDTEIICYNVTQGWKFLSRMRAHSEPITHIDFSLDGNF
jgi:WD40 repeat protein